MTTPSVEAPLPRRAFGEAPLPVASFVGAVLEPSLAAACLMLACWVRGVAVDRPVLMLALFVFTLLFPGRGRFRASPVRAAVQIASSWFALLVLLLLCGYATDSFRHFEPDVLLLWAVATPFVQLGAAVAGASTLRRYSRRMQTRRRAVIVGAGPLGVEVAQALTRGLDDGVEVLGYFDDRSDGRVPAAAAPAILGRLDEVATFVSQHAVREVYITLPLGSQPRIVALLEGMQETTASLYLVPHVFGVDVIQGRLQDVNGLAVVGICDTPFTGTDGLVKRLSDLLIAAAALAVLAPLMAAIAIGVKLGSPGPVIFRQRRNGLDGGEIVVWKFRSMTVQEDGAVVPQATRDDARTTRFGAFLRRTSLDELPQFFNVLQGRMSIVGPRPHAVAHNDEYRRLIKAYMVRHKVRPGITGWAQVNGLRGETDSIEKMRRRVEHDLHYLRHWSLALDLRIIARTVRLLFGDRHAC